MIARWQTKTKFYGTYIQRDLFNEWSVIVVWGSRSSRLGNTKNHVLHTTEEVAELIRHIDKRRKQRGYTRIL